MYLHKKNFQAIIDITLLPKNKILKKFKNLPFIVSPLLHMESQKYFVTFQDYESQILPFWF